MPWTASTLAEIPQHLIRQLFQLDADYAEALWELDHPLGSFDVKAMLRDMLAALNQLPEAIAASGKTLRHAPIPGSKTGSVRPKDGESSRGL